MNEEKDCSIKIDQKTKEYLDSFKQNLLDTIPYGYVQRICDRWSYDEIILLLLMGYSQEKGRIFIDINSDNKLYNQPMADVHRELREPYPNLIIKSKK